MTVKVTSLLTRKSNILIPDITNNSVKIINEFFDEELKINNVDYYFTNSISRSSKTMSECREARMKSKI